MKTFFLPDIPQPGAAKMPIGVVGLPASWRRSAGVAAAAALAALLHGLLFFWYLNRPAPLPFTEAAPLPMIDLMVSAPPSPALTRAPGPPPAIPPKEAKKSDAKPVKKPKPKPVKKESAVKPVDPQKERADTAPPAPPAPPAPVQERAASPRNAVFTPASSNANYLNNPKPNYPSLARSRHWEGLVVLRVHVTADGGCDEVSVQRSSGHEALDESALEAVRKWRFVPAKRGDVAQASWVTVPIEFELK
jgi:protein TonB